MSDIIKYLSEFKKKENQTITHIVKGVGSYHLEKKDIKKLYKIISKLNKPVPILERIGPISPLVIDIDLKYIDKYDERQYTKDYLKQLVSFINEKINMLFSNDDDNHLQVWIMEKENILHYACSNYRDPKSEVSIRWNDSDLKINWGVKKPLISKKDKSALSFKDFKKNYK